MSLNWSTTDIADYDEHFPPNGDYQNSAINAAIWATLAVGIGRITEANADEFYLRWRMWNQACDSEMVVTLQDVRHMVGLWTNADTRTESQFLKMLYDKAKRDLQAEQRRLDKEEAR